jgi:hypothetical protein
MKPKNMLGWRAKLRYWTFRPNVCLRLKSGQKINLSLKGFAFSHDDDGGITIHWAGSFCKHQLVWVDLKQVEAVELL